MKALTIGTILLASLLSGCIVYDNPHRDGDYRGERSGRWESGEPRRDAPPGRPDHHPNDPYRH